MTAFFDLFARNSSGSESFADPEWADHQFAALVQASPFSLWNPGDAVSARGFRVLIGVAPWSGYDMRLLDIIAAALPEEGAKQLVIEVFNAAKCRHLQDFRKYIPKLRQVFHTPVVGVWRDGELDQIKEGYDARELVARMFGSSSAEIVAFVQDWIKTRPNIQEG